MGGGLKGKPLFQWIKAGDPIYDPAHKPRRGQRKGVAISGNASMQTHPSRIGPGGLLESFSNPPPTRAEMEELRQTQTTKPGADLISAIIKAVTAKTVLRFRGDNSAKDFSGLERCIIPLLFPHGYLQHGPPCMAGADYH